MSITSKEFGKTNNGEKVTAYTLTNKNGMEVTFLDFGAIMTSLLIPKGDKKIDVVCGRETVQDYTGDGTYFGSVVGRYCNRIGGAAFTLNGVEYKLDKNDGENCLHSGFSPYNNMMYEVETNETPDGPSIEFSRLSPDMEQGFPGKLDLTITFTLTNDNEVVFETLAVGDKDTPVSITDHAYFNLAGHDSGTILDQVLYLNADAFTLTDAASIPTGEIVDVTGTPMDFRTPKPIGQDIKADYQPLLDAGGYDHNWCLNVSGKDVELAASLEDKKGGVKMEVYTDLPGLQIYTGNFLDGDAGKGGVKYPRNAACCFETQFYPDSVNHDNFPSCILKAGEKYEYTTIYKFIF
ncbi:MAG: galactose mutarotase [Lachnospiraceae bacterium]|nr:galactose mutarotase [Lachnospiraceae bacterium]